MIARSRGQILQDIGRDLRTVGGIPENPTSVLGNLASGIARAIETLERSASANYDQAFLQTAIGAGLDSVGRQLGVERKRVRKAASATGQVFYVQTGTFGDLAGGEPIFIPNGTLIGSLDGNHTVQVMSGFGQDRGGVYLQPNLSEQAVPVESLDNRSTEVILVGSLTVFNPSVQGLKTRNIQVFKGEAGESDQQYRHRIELKARANAGENDSAVRFAVLSIPGVSDVRMTPFSRGAGSMDLLIVPTGGISDAGLLNRVRAAVYSVSSSTYFTIRGAIGVPLRISVAMDDPNSVTDLTQRFIQYIDGLTPGKPFSFSDFRDAVAASISWVGATVGGVETVDEILTLPAEGVFLADGSSGPPVRVFKR